MAIRIRQTENGIVALCAAKSKAKKGDIYLNDGMHEALGKKFYQDYVEMAIKETFDGKYIEDFLHEKGYFAEKNQDPIYDFQRRDIATILLELMGVLERKLKSLLTQGE